MSQVMDEEIKRWTARRKSRWCWESSRVRGLELRPVPLLFMLLATMCCCARIPQHTGVEDYRSESSSSKCLSEEEIDHEIEEFSAALANGSMPGKQMSPQAAAKAKSEGIVGDFSILASRHSTHISYLEEASDEFNRPTAHARFPENICVVSFVLSAPEALRKKCDDDGAYGVWYTFSIDKGDVYISDVSGNIYPECSEFR
ncbi:hypothetical protein [Luteimonas lutimaris]|uniref:Uncharacterized protein n=1 Tax=Luteimonas lutimaris TaxID=698645 RepID=A0ABP7MNI9_9GAMM